MIKEFLYPFGSDKKTIQNMFPSIQDNADATILF